MSTFEVNAAALEQTPGIVPSGHLVFGADASGVSKSRSFGPPDRIKLIDRGWEVAPLREALEAHPDLWDQNPGRTAPSDSPHFGTRDIWCRFAADLSRFAEPHVSVWWPAADQLPIRQMAREVMELVGGVQLGGVLITRIPPGRCVRPHTDHGWHARHYEKIAVQIQATPGQAFHFDGQSLVTEPGDVFWFANEHTHWVTNPTDQDRITAILCIRIERANS